MTVTEYYKDFCFHIYLITLVLMFDTGYIMTVDYVLQDARLDPKVLFMY